MSALEHLRWVMILGAQATPMSGEIRGLVEVYSRALIAHDELKR
jgi:hypothetical protein